MSDAPTEPSPHPPLISGRGLLAVAVGFLAMGLVSAVATFGLLTLGRGGPDGTALWLNVASSFFAALVGGYVAGTVGRTRPMRDAAGLALVVAVIGGVGVVSPSAGVGEPSWYSWAVMVLGVVGALAGGWVRLARGIPKSTDEKLQEAFDSVVRQAMAGQKGDALEAAASPPGAPASPDGAPGSPPGGGEPTPPPDGKP